MNTLDKKIMRGIYYAYLVRVATLPGVWKAFIMLAAMVGLTYFVSLGNVVENLMQVHGATQYGAFFYHAAKTTEIWTFVLLGTLFFLTLSMRVEFISRVTQRTPAYSFARV